MKKVVLIVLMSMTTLTYAQKILKMNQYTASNGVTYKIGDTVYLGRGYAQGRFVYVTMGGIMQSTNPYANQLPPTYAGGAAIIKKIKLYKYKAFRGVRFTVGLGTATNYIIDIENAIATCEVKPCLNDKYDKYDKLLKLKELLEKGIIDNDEYEQERKKLLIN